MNFIEAARQLIQIDSSPSMGTLQVAQFLGSIARDKGFHVELQEENINGQTQANLILRAVPTRPNAEFLLTTHLDTGDPGNFGLWSRTQCNPFNATIAGDELFGLGASDGKLDFLCKMEAAKDLLNKNCRLPFVLVGTFAGHSGMQGAIKLVRKKKINAVCALVGEPTGLQIMNAGQGLAVVEIFIPFSEEEIRYRKNHDLEESSSSQSKIFHSHFNNQLHAQSSANAITKMLDYLCQLPAGIAIMDMDGGVHHKGWPQSAVLEIDSVGGFKDPIVPKVAHILKQVRVLEREFLQFSDPEKPNLNPSLQIGTIRTNDEGVRAVGTCRLTPMVSDSVYEQWMGSLRQACEQVNSQFNIRDFKRSFFVPDSSEFLRSALAAAQDLQLHSSLGTLSTTCEASVFSRLGIECLVFGPGLSVGNSHFSNESVRLEELRQATQFYRRCIERMCL